MSPVRLRRLLVADDSMLYREPRPLPVRLWCLYLNPSNAVYSVKFDTSMSEHYQRCASYSGTLNCPGLLLPGTRDTPAIPGVPVIPWQLVSLEYIRHSPYIERNNAVSKEKRPNTELATAGGRAHILASSCQWHYSYEDTSAKDTVCKVTVTLTKWGLYNMQFNSLFSSTLCYTYSKVCFLL